MRKILVAFDGSVYAQGALKYAFHIGNPNQDLITGVFIEDLSYLNYINVFGEEYLPMDFEVIDELKSETESQIEKNIEKFKNTCDKHQWNYNVHYDKGVPAYELIRESRFADLIVTGYQTFFSNVENVPDQSILKDLLRDAECPVVAVPQEQESTQNVVLSYNGTSSSMFAIKQFAYLLPQLAEKTTTYCLTHYDDDTGKKLSEEYLNSHFQSIHIKNQDKPPNENLINFTQSLEQPLLVLGSYGKNIFTRFFSTSIAEKIIKQQTIPIFMAHR